MHQEPDVGFDPESPGSRPGPKAGAKPLRHPGIPKQFLLNLDIYSPNDPAMPFLGINPRVLKIYVHTMTHRLMLVAALFIMLTTECSS